MHTVRLGLISDTHSFVHPEVLVLFSRVDTILHAGDIGDEDVITALETLAPVQAVAGNMDGFPTRHRYTENAIIEAEGFKILLTHKPPALTVGRRRVSLRGEYGVDIIIHGHTHRSRHEVKKGILIINPGSAGSSRVTASPSVALLELVQGRPPKIEMLRLAVLGG